jgi:hypothetical protein
MVVYQSPSGLFSCEAPAAWRVSEDPDGFSVSFFGPPEGVSPFSVSFGIYYYAKSGSGFASPRDYAGAQAATAARAMPVVETSWKGQPALELRLLRMGPSIHGEAAQEREERTVLIPAKDGFIAVVHSFPPASGAATEPLFERLLETLRPRG